MAEALSEMLDQVNRLADLPPDAFTAVCDREAAGLGLAPDRLAAAVEQARRRSRRNGKEGAPPALQAEPPRPLSRPAEPATPYPTDELGGVLAPAAVAIHDKVQAPTAICGSSVLAAALATQGFANVVLPTGQPRPLSLYLLSIAASGERKSSTDNEALAPVEERERELRDRHEHEHDTYEADLAAWKWTSPRGVEGSLTNPITPGGQDGGETETAAVRR